jgi:hypothetical protein
MREPIMMGAIAPPFRVFVPGLLYMAFSFYDSGDSWSGKLFKSIAIIAYSLDEFATEHGGCHLLPPLWPGGTSSQNFLCTGISPSLPVL